MDAPTIPFLQSFYLAFVWMGLLNVYSYHTKFAVRSFTCSLDIIGVLRYPKNLGSPWIRQYATFSPKFLMGFCWDLQTQILGKRKPLVVEDGTIQKSDGEFLQALSSIFTRFRDIAAFVLQHATFSHLTSSLPKMSLCSPAGSIGGWPLGYEERRCWAKCPCN